MPEIREYTPARLHSITPYLATHDPAAAIEWYTEVFDARAARRSDRDARRHASATPSCASATPCSCSPASSPKRTTEPATLGGSSVALRCTCPTPTRPSRAQSSTARRRCVRSRRTTARAAARSVDPFGHRWFVADRTRSRRRAGRGHAGPPLRRPRLHDVAGSRRRRVPRASTARCSAGRCTTSGEPGSFHIASITPPAGIQGGVDDARRDDLLPGRRHRGGRAARARARRRGAVDRRATTPAATPSASTTRASASTSSAPAPATDPPPLRTGVTVSGVIQVQSRRFELRRAGRGGACGSRWSRQTLLTCSCVRSFMMLLGDLLGVRPRRVGVRVVGLERDVVDADARRGSSDRAGRRRSSRRCARSSTRDGGRFTLSATPPQPRLSSHTLSARSRTYGIQPIWPSLYAILRRGNRSNTPDISQSVIDIAAFMYVSVEPTAAGASADVDGIFDDEPMCMQTTVSVSSHAARNGSQ